MASDNQYEVKMTKTIEVLSDEFSTIRAGKANASVLGHISVPYYGVPTALSGDRNHFHSRSAHPRDPAVGCFGAEGD